MSKAARKAEKKAAKKTSKKAAKKNNKKETTPNTPKYNVKKGDTLYSISRKYGMSVDEILRLNPGVKANELKVGMDLNLK